MSAVRYRLSKQLKFNIKSYLDREFVNNSLYVNIASGYYAITGERADVLHRVNGALYESYFNNWIYETDASGIAGFSPIIASGVIINGSFHAKGASPYKPTIDYKNGRVIFEGTNIPVGSVVSTSFSYKNIDVDYDDSERVNLIFSQIKDSVDFTQNVLPSGIQKQLPVVVIDIQGRINKPYSLGGGKQHNTLVVFHIAASNDNEFDQIIDILTENSYGKAIRGVDFNKTPQLFTSNGDVALTYKDYSTLQADSSVRFPTLFVDEADLKEKFIVRGVRIGRVDWEVKTHKSLSP